VIDCPLSVSRYRGLRSDPNAQCLRREPVCNGHDVSKSSKCNPEWNPMASYWSFYVIIMVHLTDSVGASVTSRRIMPTANIRILHGSLHNPIGSPVDGMRVLKNCSWEEDGEIEEHIMKSIFAERIFSLSVPGGCLYC